PDAGGTGRTRAATAHAPDLAVAGVPAGYGDRPVTGLPGRALAERRARRRNAGGLGLRGEPDAGAMANADAGAAGAGLVARPARQPGIAGRLHGLGAARRDGVVSLPALRLEAGSWKLEAGSWKLERIRLACAPVKLCFWLQAFGFKLLSIPLQPLQQGLNPLQPK